MKKSLTGLCVAAGLLLALPARAAVVDFDELDAGGELTPLAGLYAGLDWSADWYLGDTGVDGYGNGAHSGALFVTNGYGVDQLEVRSAAGFHFTGAWFAAPATNGAPAGWISITAYDATGRLIGGTGQVGIGAAYRWVAADFDGVARLSIARDDRWFVIDDFTLAASPVPEPGGLPPLGAGLLLVAWATRGRRRGTAAR